MAGQDQVNSEGEKSSHLSSSGMAARGPPKRLGMFRLFCSRELNPRCFAVQKAEKVSWLVHFLRMVVILGRGTS